jgi:hypothetical protein
MNIYRIIAQWELPELAPYDYIWQLDTNLHIQNMECDIADAMIRSRGVLGFYNGAKLNDKECSGTYMDIAFAYAERLPTLNNNLARHYSVSGGFLIFKNSFWRSHSARHFANLTAVSGLVFTTRLSDQEFFGVAAALLLPPDALHQFSGFKFSHMGGWGGDEVYTNAHHPFMLLDYTDPFCVVPTTDSAYDLASNVDYTKHMALYSYNIARCAPALTFEFVHAIDTYLDAHQSCTP